MKSFTIIAIITAAALVAVLSFLQPVDERSRVRTSDTDPIEAKIADMSLEEKIAELFMIGIWEKGWEAKIEEAVRSGRIGGVIVMGVNVRESPDMANAIERLQRMARESGKGPLLFATDQEGGVVSRFKGNAYDQTPQAEMKTAKQAFDVAKKRGGELAALGITVNFSPVLEYIPSRSSFLYDRVFRGDREKVAELGSAMVAGYDAGGFAATVKHFPGHADGPVDSHKDLPVVRISENEFETHVWQFRKAIRDADPPLVMTAHVLFPSLDAEYPATLSRRIIEGELRKAIGYEGVVITDDLEMGAIQKEYGLADAAVRALEAGNDILLMITTIPRQTEAFEAVLAAVRSRKITEEEIDKKVARIARLKEKFTK